MSSLRFVICLAASAALAPPVAEAADRVYGGQPSPPSAPTRVLMSAAFDESGSRLARLAYRLDLGCDPALGLNAIMVYGSPRIVPVLPARMEDGTDYLLGDQVVDGRTTWDVRRVHDLGDGITATSTGTIVGTLTERRIAGSATFLVRLSRGEESVDACSASARWRADRDPGRIFAGATTQDEPIVIDLSRDRRRVRHAHVGWHAGCTSGSEYGAAHEELGWTSGLLSPTRAFAFAHRASSFGALVTTRLTGRLGAETAAGTFNGRAQYRLPDGDRCRTGTVRWSAATG